MNRKIIIESTERDRIRGLYNLPNTRTIGSQYVFEAAFTTNERYFILNDQVFDIFEKRDLGYLWESLDIFKEIFKNTNIDDSEYQSIQETILNFPLLEGKKNLYELRDILLEFDFMKDTWVGRQFSNAGTSISDTVTSSWDGLKKFGISISKGEWSEIITLLGKGVLFVLRKLKSATYSTLGIIVDAILVATGIGKGAQMVVWGLITALDAYQIINNDFPPEDSNNPEWYKYMELGFDLLGLVTAGVAAKGAKAIFSPFKVLSVGSMSQKVAKSSNLKLIIQKVYGSSKSGVTKLKSVQKFISKKWPSGGDFINKILGGLETLIKKIQTYCGQILSKSNLKGVKNVKTVKGKGFVEPVKNSREFGRRAAVSGSIAGGTTYGVEKGIEAYTGMTPEQMKINSENMGKYDEIVNSTYGGKDPFDTWD